MGLRLRAYLELDEAVITDLPNVAKVIDSSDPKSNTDYNLGGAAAARGKTIVGWHVTDDIAPVKKALRGKTSFVKTYGPRGQNAELGPGLYVSAAPQLWMGRSTSKWGFLKNMTDENRFKLTRALSREIDKLDARRYITAGEVERARRDIGAVEKDLMYPTALTSLAGQPYNIAFWRDDFLDSAGLAGAGDPQVYKVILKGKFAKVENQYGPASLYRVLRRAGIDGVFVTGSMANVPQMVIWNPRSVKKITLDTAGGY